MALHSDDEFRHRQNVRRYTKVLRDCSTEVQRGALIRLLSEEAAAAKTRGWSPLSN
jgi:hypothetical protein